MIEWTEGYFAYAWFGVLALHTKVMIPTIHMWLDYTMKIHGLAVMASSSEPDDWFVQCSYMMSLLCVIFVAALRHPLIIMVFV